MDKGIVNNHKSHITVSAATEDGKDIILKPGKNRLTVEQFAAVSKIPVIKRYFEIGLLRAEKIGEQEKVTSVEEKDSGKKYGDEKPISRMNVEELKAKAAEREIVLAGDETRAELQKMISASLED